MSRNKLYFLMAGFCGLGFLWIGLNLIEATHVEESSLTPCLFKNLTTFPCPSCGSTRALLAIIRGNFGKGFALNPVGYIYLVGLLVVQIWLLRDFLIKKDSLYQFYLKAEWVLKKRAVAIPAIALLIINWVWNFYKFY